MSIAFQTDGNVFFFFFNNCNCLKYNESRSLLHLLHENILDIQFKYENKKI